MNSIIGGFVLMSLILGPFSCSKISNSPKFKVGDCLVTKKSHEWDKDIYVQVTHLDKTSYGTQLIQVEFPEGRIYLDRMVFTDQISFANDIYEKIDCNEAYKKKAVNVMFGND